MIINQDIEKILHELGGTSYGAALKLVLEQKKNELNKVGTLKTLEELLGRQHAIKLIDDIFSFMGEKVEKEIKKNQYT